MTVGDVGPTGRRGDIGRRAYHFQTEMDGFVNWLAYWLRPDPRRGLSPHFFDALGHPVVVGTIAESKGATSSSQRPRF